jgi:hypothetical protein
MQISTSPEFFGYELCRCADKYYGAPPHHCGLCPANCECRTGNTLSWRRGFYPILNNICTSHARTHTRHSQAMLLLLGLTCTF